MVAVVFPLDEIVSVRVPDPTEVSPSIEGVLGRVTHVAPLYDSTSDNRTGVVLTEPPATKHAVGVPVDNMNAFLSSTGATVDHVTPLNRYDVVTLGAVVINPAMDKALVGVPTEPEPPRACGTETELVHVVPFHKLDSDVLVSAPSEPENAREFDTVPTMVSAHKYDTG